MPRACAFMPSIAPVSTEVSPWLTWVEEPSTITACPPSRAAAPAQDDFVRVDWSKNSAQKSCCGKNAGTRPRRSRAWSVSASDAQRLDLGRGPVLGEQHAPPVERLEDRAVEAGRVGGCEGAHRVSSLGAGRCWGHGGRR